MMDNIKMIKCMEKGNTLQKVNIHTLESSKMTILKAKGYARG